VLPPRARTHRLTALLALAGALTGCASVLGLDAPSLDPCATTGCPDGPTSTLDASATPTADAAPDQATSTDAPLDVLVPDAAKPDAAPGVGVRCGGGSYPTTWCSGGTPTCCESADDAGTVTFACVSSATACGGYPIGCANDNDCSGSNVCCHFNSGMKCEGITACANASLICDPSSPTDCATGWKCVTSVVAGTVTLPYDICTQ
jgi:hypothetical protein